MEPKFRSLDGEKGPARNTVAKKKRRDQDWLVRESRDLVGEVVFDGETEAIVNIFKNERFLGRVRIIRNNPKITRFWRCEICGRTAVVPWATRGCEHIFAASGTLIAYGKAHPQIYK